MTNQVISGEKIFQLVDSIGLPLEIINIELRESQIAFDLSGFIKKAALSWPRKRTYNMIIGANKEINDKFIWMLNIYLDYFYKT